MAQVEFRVDEWLRRGEEGGAAKSLFVGYAEGERCIAKFLILLHENVPVLGFSQLCILRCIHCKTQSTCLKELQRT